MSTSLLGTIQGQAILRDSDDGRVHFQADADIDADGANGQTGGLAAYRPDNTGLDDLRNAKDGDGHWCGIVTLNGLAIHQDPSAPNPVYDRGAFISTTALQWPTKPLASPDRYLDSASVPFIVVPPLIVRGVPEIVLGSRAQITNLRNGRSILAVVADIGPTRKIGELSIAAAQALGIDANPRTGGESERVVLYELWPGVAATVNGITYPMQPWRS